MAFKLGMFTDGRFYWDEGSRYFTRSNWRKVLLAEYSRVFGAIRIFCRCSVEDFSRISASEIIDLPDISFTRLPQFRGFSGYIRHRRSIFRLIEEGLSDCNVCLVRIPCQVSTAGLKAAERLGKKTVCHIVGDSQHVLGGDPTILKNTLVRYIASRYAFRRQFNEVNRCARQISISRALAEKYCKSASGVKIIPNTTLVKDSFLPYRERKADEPLNALFVGRLEYHKNVQLFLMSMARVLSDGVNVITTIVGGGNYTDELKLLSEKLGISEAVRFTGRVDSREELLEYYRQAHILYLLSFTEGLGIVLMEAGAASLPVIGSRRGGIPELAKENENAFLVEPDDPAGCAEAIRKFASDEELRRQMGERSQQIMKSFTIENTVAKVSEVINGLTT